MNLSLNSGCFLTNLCKSVPFLGPYLSLKKYSYAPLNLSRQGASFKQPYDYVLSDDFFDQKKWQNWSKLKNFVKIVLITHFFQCSYSHF